MGIARRRQPLSAGAQPLLEGAQVGRSPYLHRRQRPGGRGDGHVASHLLEQGTATRTNGSDQGHERGVGHPGGEPIERAS